MEGSIGDLEIRSCPPPNRMVPEYSYGHHSKGLSAVTEEDVKEALGAMQDEPQRRPRKETTFVFPNDRGRRHELVLSEYQVMLLGDLFTAEAMQTPAERSASKNFQEGRPAAAGYDGCYVYLHDDKGVTHNLALNPYQAEVLWEIPHPGYPLSSPPSLRCPPALVVEKKVKFKIKGRYSILSKLPFVSKLQNKKKKNSKRAGNTHARVRSRNGIVFHARRKRTMTAAYSGRARTPSTRYSQATSLFVEATRGIEAAFDYALRKIKKADEQGVQTPLGVNRGPEGPCEVPPEDNPEFVFRDATSEHLYHLRKSKRHRVKLFLQRLRKRFLKRMERMDPFHDSPEASPSSPPSPRIQYRTAREVYASINNWLVNQDEPTDPGDDLVALNIIGLQKLRREVGNLFQVVRPAYQVPSPSPAQSVIADDFRYENEFEDDFEDEEPRGRTREREVYEGYQGGSHDGPQDSTQVGEDQGDTHNGAQDDAHDDAHDESLDRETDNVQGGVQDEIHYETHSDIQDVARREVEEGTQQAVQREASAREFEYQPQDEETANLHRSTMLAQRASDQLNISDTSLQDREERDAAVAAEAAEKKRKIKEGRHKKKLSSVISETPILTEQEDVTTVNDRSSFSSVSDQFDAFGIDIGALRAADEEFEQQLQLKDMRKVQPHYTGFYIVCPISRGSLRDVRINYSDHYFEPIIDPRYGNRIVLGKIYEPQTPDADDEDYRPEDDNHEDHNNEYYVPDDPDYDSSDDGIPDDDIPPFIQAARAQAPAQAVLLYLIYKGYHIDDIANEMSSLDTTFLYKSEYRWWKEIRIPHLFQMNERIIDQITLVAKADQQWWEKDTAPDGTVVTEAMRVLQQRLRFRRVKRLARKSAENYLWWRLMGERIHHQIPGGYMLHDNDI